MKPSATYILYGANIFLSSALLMVLEIVAARMIAPYVGASLYTWTAIIGVVLAGVSIGNLFGGLLADKGLRQGLAGIILIAAAVSNLLIPFLLSAIGTAIQNSPISLFSASLWMTGSLFLLPSLLLGIVTPLLTTHALVMSARPGPVVGVFHALAALGSILGTFAAGFWLVQSFGTRAVIAGTTVSLLALGIVLLIHAGKHRSATMAAILFTLFSSAWFWFKPSVFQSECDHESAYFCIRIVSENANEPPGEVRTLVLDHLVHGSNHSRSPATFVAPYMHLMDELVNMHFANPERLRYFFIGGGAYTQPRAIRHLYPDATIKVAELDPMVTQVAIEKLFFQTDGIHIQHRDARQALSYETQGQLNVVVTDAFHDIAIPAHLVTQEMAALVASRLQPNGLYLLNVVDVFPNPRLLKAIVKSLQTQFEFIDIWLDVIPDTQTRVTYVISASNVTKGPDILTARGNTSTRWFNVRDPIMQTGTALHNIPLLSDDYTPVESLMSTLFLTDLGR